MAREICRDAGAAVRKSNSAASSALFTATFSAPVAIILDSRVNRAAGSSAAASASASAASCCSISVATAR
jgi:hypothetical protein